LHAARSIWRRFTVKGVVWRHYLDWAIANVPFHIQPVLLNVWTLFFFFFAPPARRAVLRNLAIVLPGSSRLLNYFRAYRTLLGFAWSIAEAANYRVNEADFNYEIVGPEFLEQLSAARGAIVLTAHMGSSELGAALFARKCGREIRMIRTPEPDERAGAHLQATVEKEGVKIAYSSAGALLSFDLLHALRNGEIVSIQGDRMIEGVASAAGRMFDHPVHIPSGPFTLAQVAHVPIFPLFIIRTGYRSYRIIVRSPIFVRRNGERDRTSGLAAGVAAWCQVLQETIADHWPQWFGFGSIFAEHAPH